MDADFPVKTYDFCKITAESQTISNIVRSKRLFKISLCVTVIFSCKRNNETFIHSSKEDG